MASITSKPRSGSFSSKPCSQCDKILEKEEYSGAQWKKGLAKKCKACCEAGPPEVEPEWKVEAETAAAAQAEQSMEWVKRRAAEADAVEAEKAAKTAALAKAEAARVQLRNDAIAMFDSEGAENAPFSLSLDTRSGEAINSKWRGFKGQGEVQSVNFSNDGIFTVRNWSDDKKDEYELLISGWYLCRNDNGTITGRIDQIDFTGLPNPLIVKPSVGDFIEGNHQASLNHLDPKKFALTFVAARGRTRSRGGSGSF